MPELPDVAVYLDCLAPRVIGEPLTRLEVRNAFVLRSVSPSPADLVGARVIGLRRLGKRVLLAFDGDRFAVIHLMIAGRLRWRAADATPARKGAGKGAGKAVLARFEFPRGTLVLTEAGSTRRAAIHLVAGETALAQFDRGGLEPLDITLAAFTARLTSENHTLKRALTDPRLFSGIGNAYSDEILHRARLSPLALTRRLDPDETRRLFEAMTTTLREWTARLRAEVGDRFPDTVTAFRDGMAVHGRYGRPCPVCGTPVQRIRYAANETNYCARCQTGGRLLADRVMSRILREDWPRSIDDVD